jgi:carnitine 3-dehydrogenase
MDAREIPEGGRIAVLGGGTIGLGWAATYAAAGYRVSVADPNPDTHDRLSDTFWEALPVIERVGVRSTAITEPVWHADVADTCAGADFVQEALPERLPLKREVFARIEPAIGPDVIIASSSSGLSPTDMQCGLEHPERLLIAHPCNPPYLMPVVELVGGEATAAAALDTAAHFYESLGKRVLRLKREAPGHLVNRLQAALWREAVHMASEGYASVADIEAAVTEGLGARWAVCGPTAIFHLAGGDGGLGKFFDDLGPEVERWWADLGAPVLSDTVRKALIDGIEEATGGAPVETLAKRRDRHVADMIAAKRGLMKLQTENQIQNQPEEL